MSIYYWLFDRSMGPPGPAGRWPAWLVWVYHPSNLIIAACSLVAFILIVTKWDYRREGIQSLRLWLAILFLPAQFFRGLVRFFEIGGPPYHLIAIVDLIAAACWILALTIIPYKIDHIFQLKLRVQLLASLDREAHRAAEIELRNRVLAAKIAETERAIEHRRSEIEVVEWWQRKKDVLEEIAEEFGRFGRGVGGPR